MTEISSCASLHVEDGRTLEERRQAWNARIQERHEECLLVSVWSTGYIAEYVLLGGAA